MDATPVYAWWNRLLAHIHQHRHTAGLAVAYLQFFLALGELFGHAIPDVEFVVSSGDAPAVRLDSVEEKWQRLEPVLRFCKTDHHADILVPYAHFQVVEKGADRCINILLPYAHCCVVRPCVNELDSVGQQPPDERSAPCCADDGSTSARGLHPS